MKLFLAWKTTSFWSWLNTVGRAGDSGKMFLDRLEVRILKILSLFAFV